MVALPWDKKSSQEMRSQTVLDIATGGCITRSFAVDVTHDNSLCHSHPSLKKTWLCVTVDYSKVMQRSIICS